MTDVTSDVIPLLLMGALLLTELSDTSFAWRLLYTMPLWAFLIGRWVFDFRIVLPISWGTGLALDAFVFLLMILTLIFITTRRSRLREQAA